MTLSSSTKVKSSSCEKVFCLSISPLKKFDFILEFSDILIHLSAWVKALLWFFIIVCSLVFWYDKLLKSEFEKPSITLLALVEVYNQEGERSLDTLLVSFSTLISDKSTCFEFSMFYHWNGLRFRLWCYSEVIIEIPVVASVKVTWISNAFEVCLEVSHLYSSRDCD